MGMAAAKKAKGKAKGKGKGKEKAPDIPPEWVGKSAEELEAIVTELETQLLTARQRRNKSQVEHATIQSYYDATREQIRELNMRIERTDLEIENAEEDCATELRLYEQKQSFVNFCHSARLRENADESDQKTEDSISTHGRRVQDLEGAKSDKRSALSEIEEQHTAEIGSLQRANKEDIVRMKERLDADETSFEQACDDRHRQLRQELESRRAMLLKLLESRKDSHLKELGESHEHRCDDMRGYFEGVERQQEMDIEDLEAEIRRLKKAAVRNEADSGELRESNERCGEELATSSAAVVALTTQTKDKGKDATSLRSTSARLAATRRAIREAKAKYEQLHATFAVAEEERDGIRAGIGRATSAAGKADGTTRDELEMKLNEQQEQNAVLGAHLQHIVSSAGIVGVRS
ncbi:hypothetical protein ACHAXT_012010 [Thalassiosira profunda]